MGQMIGYYGALRNFSNDLPYWYWDGYFHRAAAGQYFRAVLGYRGQSKE